MRILIVGAGGHAQVVADILLRQYDHDGSVQPVGYVDDNRALAGANFLGLPVVGPIAAIPDIEHDGVIVAVGDNAVRRRLFAWLREQEEHLAVARHPSAVIAPDVRVGAGTMICAGVVVNPASIIGSNVILNTGCTVDHHNTIGDHCHISPGVHLGGAVSIGEGTLVGIGATVMPARRVGAWSVVGAGALVHRDLADGATAVGVPARVIGKANNGRSKSL